MLDATIKFSEKARNEYPHGAQGFSHRWRLACEIGRFPAVTTTQAGCKTCLTSSPRSMDGSGASVHPATYRGSSWLHAMNLEHSHGSMPPRAPDTMHTLHKHG